MSAGAGAEATSAAAKEQRTPLEQLLRERRGHIVVVNFWASWCTPCRTELPRLGRLAREYDARGVQFVGASTDAREARDEAVALVVRSAIPYPIVHGVTEADMRRLGLGSSLPATAVFDRDGDRVFRLVGEVVEKRLVERLEWLLAGYQGRPPRELLLAPGLDAGEYADGPK